MFFLTGFFCKLAKFKAFVHSTPEKFKNGVFDLKTYQMLFSVHTTPEKSENATIIGLSRCHRFRKAPFSKCFPSALVLKRKAVIFKILRCEELLRKAPFSCRISVDDGPNRRNSPRFQISPA